jgi:hypothetical protein
MKFPLTAAVSLVLLLAGRPTYAQDDAPRQLGGAPAVPAVPRPRPATAPRAIDAVPADTARATAVAPAAPAPNAPVYAPTPAGQLPGGSTRPARFQVGLKNGMVYSANDVEVKSPLFSHSFLLLDGQRRLDFAEVGYYEDESGHYVRTTLPGSNRETTFRREKTGRISLYSTTSTSYSPSYGGMGGGFGYGGMGYGGMPYGGYRTTKTLYFSKDNGPIENMTMKNLALATRDNAGSQQLLAEARRYQNYTTLSYVAGGGLLVAGLLQSFRPGAAGISPLTYAAIPVLIVPLVLQSKQMNNQRQAIALYNSGAVR